MHSPMRLIQLSERTKYDEAVRVKRRGMRRNFQPEISKKKSVRS